MLITFRSSAADSVTMFGDAAATLLRMMGASGKIPGGFSAQDVPLALRRLESSIEQLKALPPSETPAPPAMNEDAADEQSAETQRVAITARAVPLLSLLKRAVASSAEVIWEAS